MEILAVLVARELAPLLQRKEWLSLKEAALEYHIGEHRLKHLGKTGSVKGFPDPESKRGDWIFHRGSLDTYRLSQANMSNSIDQKYLAIKARMRL